MTSRENDLLKLITGALLMFVSGEFPDELVTRDGLLRAGNTVCSGIRRHIIFY